MDSIGVCRHSGCLLAPEMLGISLCHFNSLSEAVGLIVGKALFRQEFPLNSFVINATHQAISEHLLQGISIRAVLGQLS